MGLPFNNHYYRRSGINIAGHIVSAAGFINCSILCIALLHPIIWTEIRSLFLQPYLMYLPAGGAVLGLIIGSFLATVVARWPRGQSVVVGRSHCDSCAVQLEARDLIPLISFLIQMGKCRKCGAPISSDHIAIEISAGLIGGLALLFEPNAEGLLGAVFGWTLLVLAALDAKHHWLPDRLVLLLAIVGLAGTLIVETPDIYSRLVGGVTGFLSLHVIGLMYRKIRNREGLGGGDPKLLGAIGCWLGWPALPFVVLGASAIALVAVCTMMVRGQAVHRTSELPLGTFMAIAAFPIWLMQNESTLFSPLLNSLI